MIFLDVLSNMEVSQRCMKSEVHHNMYEVRGTSQYV